MANGYDFPVIDGIDLNSDKSQVLASYHAQSEATPLGGEFYENERELERAFEARATTRIAALTAPSRFD